MTHATQDLRLPVEEVHDLVVGGHGGPDDLDRVPRAEPHVTGQVDLPHATAAQQPLYLIGIDQQGTGRDAVQRGRLLGVSGGSRRLWSGAGGRCANDCLAVQVRSVGISSDRGCGVQSGDRRRICLAVAGKSGRFGIHLPPDRDLGIPLVAS